MAAGSHHPCKGESAIHKGSTAASSGAMSEWQWASLRPHKVPLGDLAEMEAKQFLPDGSLEYLWRDNQNNNSSQCSQFAALLGGKVGDSSFKQRIHVSQGNYFGAQAEASTSTSTSSGTSGGSSASTSSPSWRTAGSQQLAALVAQQSVANCDLPPPSPETVIRHSRSPSSGGGAAEVFGEALCRSQSRAREAESLALRACHEKDELRQLLMREASISLAYRQCLALLRAENLLLLRMCKWSSMKNHKRKKIHRSSRNREDSCSDALLRCTVAFAVGLGLASAGVMLGWSMGWILFSAL